MPEKPLGLPHNTTGWVPTALRQENFGKFPFQALFKELRTGRGLSIRKLAEEAGVSTETIYSLEHGRREFIWPRTAKKLADALGVKVQDLGLQ